MIHWIPSPDDQRLEPYRHVADSVWLNERGLFVAEGRLVVERLLALDTYEVRSILVNHAAHDALFEVLSSAKANVLVCADPTLASITGYNFHRGCLALACRPRARNVDEIASGRRLLAIENVGNPDNIGGLFRTAAAFAVDGVLLNGQSGDPLYRKAVRTSMGAALRLPYAREPHWQEMLGSLKTRGFRLVALTPSAGAVDLRDFAGTIAPEDKLVTVVGSEGHGLCPSTLQMADACVTIPIDSRVDSLNVVVAAGIALAQIR